MKFTLKVFLTFSKVLCKKNTQRLSHYCDSYTISCTFFSISKNHFHCMTFVLKIICQIKFCPNTILSFKFHACTFFIDTETVIDDQIRQKHFKRNWKKSLWKTSFWEYESWPYIILKNEKYFFNNPILFIMIVVYMYCISRNPIRFPKKFGQIFVPRGQKKGGVNPIKIKVF